MSEIKVNSIKGVGASAAAITVNNTDGTCTANLSSRQNPNLIINGAMLVAQRGSSMATGDGFAVDRFRLEINGTNENPTLTQADVASGTTPYVVGAIKKCSEQNILTGCITCNSKTPLAKNTKYPIEVIVGPEVITGSTRMKAGTAQKLVLNIISTTLMIKMGKIKDNKMIDMQLSNNKLIKRAENILIKELEISHEQAKKLLDSTKSVRKSLEKK